MEKSVVDMTRQKLNETLERKMILQTSYREILEQIEQREKKLYSLYGQMIDDAGDEKNDCSIADAVLFLQKYDKKWQEYRERRDENDKKVNAIRQDIVKEEKRADKYYKRSVSAFKYGTRSEAIVFAEKERESRDRIESLKREMNGLINDTKKRFEKTDQGIGEEEKSLFQYYRSILENQKKEAEKKEKKVGSLTRQRDQLLGRAYELEEELISLGAAQLKLEDELSSNIMKMRKKRREFSLMAEAGVPKKYFGNCKIVKKIGFIHFYFGGIGKPDGIFHGHIVMKDKDRVMYARMPNDFMPWI